MAPFIDNIKFHLWNLNINKLMLIHFHISLITKRFFRSFDHHCDKTVTLSELLQDINNFSKTIVDVIRKCHEFSFKIVRVITIVASNPVNFLVNARLWRQSIASWYSMASRFFAILLLSPLSYILYTMDTANPRLRTVRQLNRYSSLSDDNSTAELITDTAQQTLWDCRQRLLTPQTKQPLSNDSSDHRQIGRQVGTAYQYIA